MTQHRWMIAWLLAKFVLPPLSLFPLSFLIIVWTTDEPMSWYALLYIVGGTGAGLLFGMCLMRAMLPGLMAGTLIKIREDGRNGR